MLLIICVLTLFVSAEVTDEFAAQKALEAIKTVPLELRLQLAQHVTSARTCVSATREGACVSTGATESKQGPSDRLGERATMDSAGDKVLRVTAPKAMIDSAIQHICQGWHQEGLCSSAFVRENCAQTCKGAASRPVGRHDACRSSCTAACRREHTRKNGQRYPICDIPEVDKDALLRSGAHKKATGVQVKKQGCATVMRNQMGKGKRLPGSRKGRKGKKWNAICTSCPPAKARKGKKSQYKQRPVLRPSYTDEKGRVVGRCLAFKREPQQRCIALKSSDGEAPMDAMKTICVKWGVVSAPIQARKFRSATPTLFRHFKKVIGRNGFGVARCNVSWLNLASNPTSQCRTVDPFFF